ncbi:MAG: hypothetical protein ACK5MU_00725 [Candidatus Saccharimonadales bacterium]
MADEKRPVTAKPTNDIVAQVAERIKTSDNVLIALSKDPSVDELSAAIGLTFLLDKMGKHATAIFSGAVPNAIEFLEPEKTFEVNTNSLQDFIIALDKDKADHLRYKIDGNYVKVYITPYKTTIDETDLEFSHGDFNVDLVVALDVSSAEDLDKALSEHGRIMHDASAINISTAAPGKFGDMQWSDPAASSVSEMICVLADKLKDKENLLDKPIATAFLAGIVAATSRFSNEHTAPSTMTMASKLMEAGADQQLISSSIPVDLDAQMADAGTGMPVQEPAEEEKLVEETEAPEEPEEPEVAEPVIEEALAEEVDPSKLSVDHGETAEAVPEAVEETPVEEPAEPEKVEEPAPVEEPEVAPEPKIEEKPVELETPEQQLEKIIQTPSTEEARGPLMDELREAAEQRENRIEPEHEVVLEPLSGPDKESEKDYAKLMDAELSTPAPVNAATQAAPSAPSTVEINGIPDINYATGADSSQPIAAPVMSTESETPAPQPVEPVQAAQVVEPVVAEPVPAPAPVVEPTPAAPVAVEPVPVQAEPVAAPLPMPDVSSEFLPPPPPPFDPSAPVGAVDFSPAAPAMPQPVVEPIAPAAPEAPVEVEHSYLGSNPAMPDQIYPPASNDPGAFQLPTPTA